MELLQLQYFLTAAREENFSHAARRHFIPQSAMSKTIANLEAELGVQLFERRGNRVFLNERGARFRVHVEAALRELENAVSQARESGEEICGEIRLLVRCCRSVVTACIASFRAQYKDVTFFLNHDQYGMTQEQFDFLICDAEHLPATALHTRELMQEEIFIAVSEHHPLAQAGRVALSDLKEERFIMMPPTSSIFRQASKVCHIAGFDPKVSVFCDDPFHVRNYVKLGMGITFMPGISWSSGESSIVLLPIEGERFYRSVILAYDDKKYFPRSKEIFMEDLIKQFQIAQENFYNSSNLKKGVDR